MTEATPPNWEARLASLWRAADDYSEADFVGAMEALVIELPAGSAIAAYERGSAFDSTGHSDRAIPLYRDALALGLGEDRRRQAVIQLASSLRNLGHAAESVTLLTAEQREQSDALDDAVAGFLALALVDAGREREATAVALRALSRHLVRYRRSLASYAESIAPAPTK